MEFYSLEGALGLCIRLKTRLALKAREKRRKGSMVANPINQRCVNPWRALSAYIRVYLRFVWLSFASLREVFLRLPALATRLGALDLAKASLPRV